MKVMHYKSNVLLAADFCSVAGAHGYKIGEIECMARKIATAPIDVRKYYQHNKGFKNIGIRGVGDTALRIVEKILVSGVDQAKEGIKLEREQAVRQLYDYYIIETNKVKK